MAEKIFNTRILNKVDTLENWNKSTLPLKKGEIALATVAAAAGTGLTEPVVMIKVGEDGVKTFKDLEWNVYAKASDVVAAAKSEAALTAFINNVIDGAGIATDEALTTLSDRVDAVEGLVGDTKVATQISDAIAALKLAETYDAKGAADDALADAKEYADGLNTAMDARVQVVEGKAHEHANKAELDKIVEGDKAKWDAMEQNAKDYADGLDGDMDTRVQALEAKFGDGEGNVESQIAAAVNAEKTAREAADTALQEKITANDGEIAALSGLVGDKKVSEQITDVTNPLDNRVATIEGDYLKAADKKELQDQIDANESAIELLTNGVSADEVDGVNDLIQYVKDHGTEVTGIKADIKGNTDAIAAEKQRAEGIEGGLETRLAAVEAAVGDEGAVAGDIAAALTEAKGYTDSEVKKLSDGAVATNAADIDALETKVGDKPVADQISAAIAALAIGDYAKAADLTAEVNRAKAAEEANAAAAAAAQAAADKAQGEVDALETQVGTIEEQLGLKANSADLHAIATSGNVNDLVQTDGDVLVFDCGTSV